MNNYIICIDFISCTQKEKAFFVAHLICVSIYNVISKKLIFMYDLHESSCDFPSLTRLTHFASFLGHGIVMLVHTITRYHYPSNVLHLDLSRSINSVVVGGLFWKPLGTNGSVGILAQSLYQRPYIIETMHSYTLPM